MTAEPSGTSDTFDLAQGASVALVGKIAGRTLHLLTQIGIGRIFGPYAYGLFAIGFAVMRIAGLISVLGMDATVLRYGARHAREDPDGLRGVLAVGLSVPLAIGMAIGGTSFALAGWLATSVFSNSDLAPIIRWFSLGIPLLALLRVAAAATRISKRMRFYVFSEELTQPAVALLLILAFNFIGLGIVSAAAATVVSVGLGLGVALKYVRRLFPVAAAYRGRVSAPCRKLLRYSVSVSGAGVFIMLMTWIDRLALGSFRSASEVGIYQAAAQSAVLFAIVLGGFTSIFSPIVADLWHRGEEERLEATYRISTKWGLYLSLPFFVVICTAPAQVLSAVYGVEYASGALPLVILAVAQLITAGTGAVGSLLSMTGHQENWVLTAGAMLAVDAVLMLALVPRLGILGAAIATGTALAGLFLLGLTQARALVGVWPYDRRFLKGIAATAASFMLVYWLSRLPGTGSLLWLAALTLASLVAFGAVLVGLGLDSEDRQLIDIVRSRLRTRAAGEDH